MAAPDPEAVAEIAARMLDAAIADALARRGVAHVALAGGTTPAGAYQALAAARREWRDVHLWLTDERHVPSTDPASNAAMIRDSLSLASRNEWPRLHVVAVDLELDRSAATYAEELRAVVPLDAQGMPQLDVVLLGLGEDGHTASLFPHDAGALASDAPCVAVRDAPKPPPERVSLTVPALRTARARVVVVTGTAKAGALARIADGVVGRLTPVTVVCDRAAASG